jgi:uncharacterized phage-associated protein
MSNNIYISKDKAILAAEYFIWKSKTKPKPTGLDKLKLQKLLYYAQAWNLVFNKNPLFQNKIEAWIHGPAVPEVYQFFKNFDFTDPSIKFEENDFNVFSAEEKKILNNIWEVYGKYDGPYLETLTHSELPWQEARSGVASLTPSQNVISTDRMQQYYGERLARING